MLTIPGKFTTAKIMIDSIDEKTMGQIVQFINHPTFNKPVAVMPDTHYGAGAAVGFTMGLSDTVIPNVIGVDIGCGMLSMNMGKVVMPREQLDKEIRKVVPLGTTVHKRGSFHMKKDFQWERANRTAHEMGWGTILCDMPAYEYNMEWFQKKCKEIGMDFTRAINSIGTLGGGNHFIEAGKDPEDNTWITIHSGSRQLGEKTARYWQKVAVGIPETERRAEFSKYIKEIKAEYGDHPEEIQRHLEAYKAEHKITVDTKGLEFLEGDNMGRYLHDMIFAQEYARANRKAMGLAISGILSEAPPVDAIESVHNFIDPNDNIIRKGAIKAYKGSRMIIPFNMEDGILVCEGKSNEEWNFSAPHGAGRLMSRTQAKKELKLEDMKAGMAAKDVYNSGLDKGILDEARGAYKDPKIIEDAIGPTADVLFKIKPFLNIKSG